MNAIPAGVGAPIVVTSITCGEPVLRQTPLIVMVAFGSVAAYRVRARE